MRTGLEDTAEDVLKTLVHNLKVGILKVVDLGPKALVSDNPKECPPVAAFETNMALLRTFEKEFDNRGLDFHAVEPNIREIYAMWRAARPD
jgi:hypothetical protein